MKTFTLSALALAIMLTGCESAPSLNNVTNNTETSPLNTEQQANPWWETAIFYQIWPRSFYDSDADGHGDFNGMTQKLPYLQELGVNALWLTPMFE
ncbi:alpha-amylase family glycosyl hydrolase, partial [Pseudoalteromonas sp. Angola-31]|nr:alpha-amylase family glycosyl hydrolase [Pseudoalteromonas sp. Angola-31]